MDSQVCLMPLLPERELLFYLFQHEKDARMARRYQAMYLLRCKWKFRDVVAVVGISAGTLSRWSTAYQLDGVAGLRPKKIPGPAPRLTPEQRQELDADLQQSPRDLGYDFSTWDGKKVMYHVAQKFGVQLKVRSVQVLMHKLEFTLQRPRSRCEKTDKAAEAAWAAEFEEKKTRVWT